MSVATAIAEPLDDPPGITSFRPSRRLFGVPKKLFLPETVIANSGRLVFPTIRTFRSLASARSGASRAAGAWFFEIYSDPAEVTLPFMSMLSFTASRQPVLPAGGGQ